MNILDNRPLPHNVDAEMSILGCLLIDNSLIEKARQAFDGKEVFYAKKNQVLYDAMVGLCGKQLPIDIVNLRYSLKENGFLDLVGESYLVELEDILPHALSFDFYANEVLKLFNNRKKIELSVKIIEGAYAGVDVDTSELIPLLENYKTDSTGIIRPSDLENEVLKLHESGGLQPGLSTGWPSADEYYTVKPGQLSIITGIPSHGKSTWVTNLMVNLARRYGWKFAVFSPENQPLTRYIGEIISMYVDRDKSFNKLSHGEVLFSLEWANNHFTFLEQPDTGLTIDDLIDKAKICISKYGIKGFVIDPWNEINHSRPDGQTETEYVSLCLSKFKRLAQAHQTHIWLVAHPTKLQKRVDGTYGVPTLYDISGSAHFRNKADNGICVWRDVLSEGNETEIHIQKIRFREVGKPGMVTLKYNVYSSRFE